MISEPHLTSTCGGIRSQPSVVYIVDDESIRLGLHYLLLSAGPRVETFGSSQEFLSFAKYDAPSCLILDVRVAVRGSMRLLRTQHNRPVRMTSRLTQADGGLQMILRRAEWKVAPPAALF